MQIYKIDMRIHFWSSIFGIEFSMLDSSELVCGSKYSVYTNQGRFLIRRDVGVYGVMQGVYVMVCQGVCIFAFLTGLMLTPGHGLWIVHFKTLGFNFIHCTHSEQNDQIHQFFWEFYSLYVNNGKSEINPHAFVCSFINQKGLHLNILNNPEQDIDEIVMNQKHEVSWCSL